ncbi:hypothetical protein HY404_02065 [Candidatus Microgenomates bacterium]|nr:hypothetical protein [Candidatus Microgenomates bacterium]
MEIAGVQLLLGAVVLILTALLVFVGVQVIFILKDVRGTVKKINHTISQSAQTSTLSAWGLLEHVLKSGKNSTSEYENSVTSTAQYQTDDVVVHTQKDSLEHITALQERGRRVFHRQGKPLA